MTYRKTYTCLFVLIMTLALVGCSGDKAKNIGKSDIDIASDTIIKSLDDYLRRLAYELYKINPKELAKLPNINLEQRLTQIIDYPVEVAYQEINNTRQIEAIKLALDNSYNGDRVFALMIGISSMIRYSYNNQREFFLFDTIDPQKLYDSSYNLQLLKQRLANMSPKLLNIATDYGETNNAYTLIEKISTTQDLMSRIIADKDSRAINRTLIGTAAVFIPII